MTRLRSQLISLDATHDYHCIARCVRPAYPRGEDEYTGKNFDHRREWLVERLSLLAEVFATDIAAYAIMRNHIHLVLHINQSLAMFRSDDEVVY